MLATLLLQATSFSWPNIIAAAVVAAFSFFLVRLITQIDKKLDDNCAAVSRMGADMRGYELLAEHLREKNEKLESKVDVLTNSHAKIDKFIAVQMALHKINIPEN